MPKIKYEDVLFQAKSLDIIDKANKIIGEFTARGYSLTLRQVYYQFVSRDWFPEKWADKETGSTNNERSYDKLGVILSNGRLAGLIDWNALEDRTREIDGNSHWSSPSGIIESAANSFALDKWQGQEYRVEVWVEKDALEGVVGKAARELDIPFFSCRGYTSQTAIWNAGQRLKGYAKAGQRPVILHLGDHDPSGLDMSRDVRERLRKFMDARGQSLTFNRIALNRDQVVTYSPPPNPAKATDVRFADYKKEHGDECWELDALDPGVIDELIREEVGKYRDDDLYAEREALEADYVDGLRKAADRWGEVAAFLKGETDE